MPKCSLCQVAVQAGDTYSGLDTPAGYLEGHLACVVRALPGDALRAAIAAGRLPPVTPDGRVAGDAHITPQGTPRRYADQVAAGLRPGTR